MTISSFSKLTSGTLSATFHALQRASQSLALVITPFSGMSFWSFSSSTDPFHILVGVIGVGAAEDRLATASASNAAKVAVLVLNMIVLLDRMQVTYPLQ